LPSRALARAVGAALGIAVACDASAAAGSSGGAAPPSAAHAGAAAAVYNCADSGTGSLRAAIASAASGDTIEMSDLQCSSISLTTGALQVTVDNLTLVGPAGGLTVNGRRSTPYAQVLVHPGTGTLTVRNMTLQNGRTTGPHGGCVESQGSVVLDHANVNSCFAYDFSPATCPALGGGVYAHGNLSVLDSTIANNAAGCYSGSPMFKVKIYGGGAFAGGDMVVRRSSITNNYVGAGNLASFSYAFGGGLSLRGNLEITDSTIAQNRAGYTNCFYFLDGSAGGIDVPGASSTVTISNSTISGNSAAGIVGGIFSAAPLTLANSTVAFNTSASDLHVNGHDYAPGVHVQNTSANLQSSIIANNLFNTCTDGGFLTDLTGLNATITGADNLIMGSTVAPPGSLTADPQLGALADNGGPTLTHKPGDASPVIAKGNNADGFAFDQRGSGHARSFSGKTDIGAFQTGDSPFNNGFDAPP
jgi:hypothetical protein